MRLTCKECLICISKDIRKVIKHNSGKLEQRKSKINGEFCTLKSKKKQHGDTKSQTKEWF